MAIRLYKPYTAGTRNRSVSDFSEITASQPEKTLLAKMGYTKIAGQWFRITAEQIAEAQTLAREWQPK